MVFGGRVLLGRESSLRSSLSCIASPFEDVWRRPIRTVGVCGEELPAVVLVVGGGAPDP